MSRAELLAALAEAQADSAAAIARLRAQPTWREGVEAAAALLTNEDAVYAASRYFLPQKAAVDLAAAIRAIPEPKETDDAR